MGLYQNIVTLVATVAGCGIGSSGVRQLAAASGSVNTLALVRRALWIANVFLGFAGMLFLWALRKEVALWVFGDSARVAEVGWLGVGVLLTLIAGSQTALLQGLRRIGDLALIKILGAILGGFLGVGFVWVMGEPGVLWFVISAPAISALIAAYFASRLPHAIVVWGGEHTLRKEWKVMLKQGVPFMGAALLTVATQFMVRSLVTREFGLSASGHFQAAWSISMTYLGFVLGSMGADYYPRLTQSIGDQESAKKLVNEQMQAAILLAAPVLTAMIGFAPWVIEILYSSEFAQTVEILRWQVMGAVLKVICWPMGFIILAQGRSKIFLCSEFAWNAVYLSLIFGGFSTFGVAVTGLAFFWAYVVYFLILLVLSWKLLGFRIHLDILVLALCVLLVGFCVIWFFGEQGAQSMLFCAAAAASIALYCLWRLDSLMDLRALGVKILKRKK